jgi:ADP-ribose pyrophosphatase
MTEPTDPKPDAAADAHLSERTLSSDQVYLGHFLDVRRDLVALPNGRTALREYIVHPGAVMVVPMLDDGRLVVERQYRYPMGRVMLEFPAGKLDPGESAFECAVRELKEETGYTAREWARAGVLHNAIAYSNEGIEVWFARGLSAGPRGLDDGEFLDVIQVTQDQLLQWAGEGSLTDAKTLIGLLWLQNWCAGRWSVQWQAPLAPPRADKES